MYRMPRMLGARVGCCTRLLHRRRHKDVSLVCWTRRSCLTGLETKTADNTSGAVESEYVSAIENAIDRRLAKLQIKQNKALKQDPPNWMRAGALAMCMDELTHMKEEASSNEQFALVAFRDSVPITLAGAEADVMFDTFVELIDGDFGADVEDAISRIQGEIGKYEWKVMPVEDARELQLYQPSEQLAD